MHATATSEVATMRIVHVIAPAPVGGAEQVVRDLTRALALAGVDTHVIAVLDQGTEDHPFLRNADPEVSIHPLPLPARAYASERRAIGKVLAQVQPTVVHTHGYRSNVIAASAARGSGLPVVSTAHGFTGSGWKIRAYQAAERWSFRRAHAVVAVSSPIAAQLGEMGVRPGSTWTIPNTRHPPEGVLPRELARESLKVPKDAFHVGWIGRMSREKAPDVMLEAISLVQDRGVLPHLHVSMLGDGPMMQPLRERTDRLGLAERVRWHGRVPDASRLMKGFDVLVLSSRSEGTPIVALEAMLLRTPLVATDVGGVGELVGPDGALLKPPSNPLAIARAIEDVQASPEAAARRAESAFLRAHADYSPAQWAAQHLEVYRTVTASPPRS